MGDITQYDVIAHSADELTTGQDERVETVTGNSLKDCKLNETQQISNNPW